MELNEALQLGLDVNFDEAKTLVGMSNINNSTSNLILDMPDSKKNILVFNTLYSAGILKSGSVISYIPDVGKLTSAEKFIIRNEDDVYYVGVSRGSFQFFVITNSEVDFYLFL